MKCGIRKSCLDKQMKCKIEKDVSEGSDSMVEASLYMHYYLTRMLKDNFDVFLRTVLTSFLLDMYYHLPANKRKEGKDFCVRDDDYINNVRPANRPLYDG
ncbi:hypothetical protein ABEB36_000320 [Hypothenemus hampei]|uniref:Uncharacterized protein n=1 Tax=Hypothenemus hampei TaxID=57062 RepID=A0ABD1FAU6_HYPHA